MATVYKQRLVTYEEEIPHSLANFRNWEFTSGSTTGADFKTFARLFRNYVKKQLPEGAALVKFNTGHYYVSGFIHRAGKYVYFSISDVRFYHNQWYRAILVRTAESDTDFTGGINQYALLPELGDKLATMLR